MGPGFALEGRPVGVIKPKATKNCFAAFLDLVTFLCIRSKSFIKASYSFLVICILKQF